MYILPNGILIMISNPEHLTILKIKKTRVSFYNYKSKVRHRMS